SRLLPPERWSCFVVSAQTLRRWHRALLLGKRAGPRGVGRPPLAAETRNLIERLARENATWGYMRIQGELKGLGISVSATTVASVLRSAGLGPAPRRIGPSWSAFLRAQAESLVGSGLRSALADGLAGAAVATREPADDHPAPIIETDEACATPARHRTHALPRSSLQAAHARPQESRCLRPSHRWHARDGPDVAVGARPQPRAVESARRIFTATACPPSAPTPATPQARARLPASSALAPSRSTTASPDRISLPHTSLRKTSSNGPLYLLSRSRMRKRTPLSLKSRPRLRACWVTHSPVGFLVQPASQTRRLACSMKKRT